MSLTVAGVPNFSNRISRSPGGLKQICHRRHAEAARRRQSWRQTRRRPLGSPLLLWRRPSTGGPLLPLWRRPLAPPLRRNWRRDNWRRSSWRPTTKGMCPSPAGSESTNPRRLVTRRTPSGRGAPRPFATVHWHKSLAEQSISCCLVNTPERIEVYREKAIRLLFGYSCLARIDNDIHPPGP